MSLIIFSFFYNRAEEVGFSVSSLLRAAPHDSCIVLVNDGSTDSTSAELHNFCHDERVSVIDQSNAGLSGTMAKVIPAYLDCEKYSYIAIHGAGDICHEKKFEKQLEYMEQNNDVVALGCGHRLVSAASRNVLSVSRGEVVADINFLRINVPFTHGTVLYRVDAFLSAGGYDALFKCCQDWDLYFRLVKLGKLVRVDEVLYDKYLFDDGVSFNPKKKIEQIKYFKVVTSRVGSEDSFYHLKNILEKYGIDEAVPTKDILRHCKRHQYSLILSGEYSLALQWCDLIDSGIFTRASQVFISIILRCLIFFGISINFTYFVSGVKRLVRC